ncbi:Ribonuclease 3-like protein 1 [Hirschfeldia incana]|nr:Ribonuclease 3-like protein 1 [Hirschfeldia incana]
MRERENGGGGSGIEAKHIKKKKIYHQHQPQRHSSSRSFFYPHESLLLSGTVPKQRYQEISALKIEEDNVKSSFSNIQIDPNSTRSVDTTTQETWPLLKPKEDNPKSISKDESKKGSAKMVLHELCISKRWKPPVYDCCNVDGPCHMRLFTYKVVVEIRDSSGTTVLECFGDPKPKKKDAAEHAAEGALWYLDHVKGKSHKKLHK